MTGVPSGLQNQCGQEDLLGWVRFPPALANHNGGAGIACAPSSHMGMAMNRELLREIPKTDVLLDDPLLMEACERLTRAQVRSRVQEWQERVRAEVLAGVRTSVPGAKEAARQVACDLERTGAYSLRRVINATGVVLHTNLGRAPLGEEVSAHVAEVARGYSNLEYDLARGVRGSRFSHVEELVCKLCGSEAAMVVNNNAGAVFLMLSELAAGQPVAVSRGELVEIGGSFRVPEIMAKSGAALIEVGTTNKTHLSDYVGAIEDGGAVAVLKVHTSNFVMSGFTEEVECDRLARAAHERGRLCLYDLGSALPVAPGLLGLHEGCTARQAIAEGADVVCFSADKLLGAGQAGIIAGRAGLIGRIRRNQLARILRIDKLSLAALEMTLAHCLDAKVARERVPVLSMLAMTRDECRANASHLRDQIAAAAPCLELEVVPVVDEAGGGSLPGVGLPGEEGVIGAPSAEAAELEGSPQSFSVPVIARVARDRLLLSARTVLEGDEGEIVEALSGFCREASGRLP